MVIIIPQYLKGAVLRIANRLEGLKTTTHNVFQDIWNMYKEMECRGSTCYWNTLVLSGKIVTWGGGLL